MTEQLLLECEKFIRNGGLLTGSSFGRIEIPFCKMMDIDTDDAEQYLQQHRENTCLSRSRCLPLLTVPDRKTAISIKKP